MIDSIDRPGFGFGIRSVKKTSDVGLTCPEIGVIIYTFSRRVLEISLEGTVATFPFARFPLDRFHFSRRAE